MTPDTGFLAKALALLTFPFLAGAVIAQEQVRTADAPLQPVLLVVSVGSVTVHRASFIAEHIERQLRIDAVNATNTIKKLEGAQAQASMLAAFRKSGFRWVVGLVEDRSTPPVAGLLSKATGVALVNVQACMGLDANQERNAERILMGESVGAVARLAGLHDCPQPRCALHPLRTQDDRKLRGINLCPPCGEAFYKSVTALGVRTVPVRAMFTRKHRDMNKSRPDTRSPAETNQTMTISTERREKMPD